MLSVSKNRGKRLGQFFQNPARIIVGSFALLILLGTLLLMLPAASRTGRLPFLEALFTATSATCVTGLVVADTFTQFSLFGQIVILGLIQLGGLGLVTFVTFFNLSLRRRVGFKSLSLAQESISSDSLSDVRMLLRMIFALTFLFEMAGAGALMTVFIPKYQGEGVFLSIFLAVSAYCNAGFDILGFEGPFSSLTSCRDNPVVLCTIMVLILCGGLGFIVWEEIFHFRKQKKLSLHTKIVLIATGTLLLLGAAGLTAMEWSNQATLGDMPAGEKLLNGLFMSVSARTAGFNTVPLDRLRDVTKLFMSVLMFIGAAPGSTGGGVKVTTVYVLLMTVVCVMRGREDTVIDKRRVDKSTVYKALTITTIALLAVCLCSGVLFFSIHDRGFSEIDAAFEAVSAFGTVGLSCGVTGAANLPSRIALILMMFLGRVGPVSLALSLAARPQDKSTVMPEAKILVG